MKHDHMDEDVRSGRAKGLSERDAVLKSIKRTKADNKKNEKATLAGPMTEDYPYGSRLDLDAETLDKLGLDELPGVGDEVTIHAIGKVQSTSENTYNGEKPRRSVTIQITKMSVK